MFLLGWRTGHAEVERWPASSSAGNDAGLYSSGEKRGLHYVNFFHNIQNIVMMAEFILFYCPTVLWRCWLGGRNGNWPLKTEWWGAGMVICLEQDADLHMAQLMPLPLASVKFRLVLPFWYQLTQVVPDKGPLNGCCCCCRCYCCWTELNWLKWFGTDLLELK